MNRRASTFFWIFAIGLFTCTVDFWIPTMYAAETDWSLLVRNFSGSFIRAVIDTLSTIRTHSIQTRIIHKVISFTSCSILTTYGNVLYDFGRIFYHYKPQYLLIVVLHAFGSFSFYYLGKKIVSTVLENELAVSRLLSRFRNPKRKLEFALTNPESRAGERDPLIAGTKLLYGDLPLEKATRAVRAKRSPRRGTDEEQSFTAKHLAAAFILYAVPLANVGGLLLYRKYFLLKKFLLSAALNMSGSLLGNWLIEIQSYDKYYLQYRAFKVNTLSGILLSAGYSLGLAIPKQSYIERFAIVSFQFDFCGTMANWSSLVSSTHNLWRHSPWISTKNFLGSFGIALGAYLVLNYFNTFFHFFTF